MIWLRKELDQFQTMKMFSFQLIEAERRIYASVI